MIKLIEKKIDFDIKMDLYRFINGEYDSYLSVEQIKIGIEYSFILNYSRIEDNRLIFNYEDFKVIVPFDDILGIEPEQIKKTAFFWLSNDEIFKGALKSFLRNHKLTKLLG